MSHSPNPTRPRRLAVLFGISKYTDPFPLLSSVVKDINDLANTLRQGLHQDFNYDRVDVYENEDVTQQKLESILNNLAQDSPIDELFVYFAGHGCLKATKSYFVTYGAELINPGIRLSDLSDLLQLVKPQKVFVLLDFCYAGDILKTLNLEKLNSNNITLTPTEKLAILAATRSSEKAVSGNNNDLSFTQYFINTLTTFTSNDQFLRWGQIAIKVCALMERSLYQRPVNRCDFLSSHIFNKIITKPTFENFPEVVNFFHFYGTLPKDNPSYIIRPCDLILEQMIPQATFISVIGEYQIGKSSLFVKTAANLSNHWKSCYINFQLLRTDDFPKMITGFFKKVSDEFQTKITDWQGIVESSNSYKLVFFFDEIKALENNLERFLGHIFYLVENCGKNLCIVVSSPKNIEEILIEHCENPKYLNIWYQIKVERFTNEEVYELINRSHESIKKVCHKHIQIVINYTLKHPKKLQKLLFNLTKAIISNKFEELENLIYDQRNYN